MFSRGQSTCALAAALHAAEEPCTHPVEKEKKTDTERQPRPTPHGPNHHLTGSTSRWTGQQQNCRNRTNTVRHLKELELLKLEAEQCQGVYLCKDRQHVCVWNCEVIYCMLLHYWQKRLLSFFFDTKNQYDWWLICMSIFLPIKCSLEWERSLQLKAVKWRLLSELELIWKCWIRCAGAMYRVNAFHELLKQIWMFDLFSGIGQIVFCNKIICVNWCWSDRP